MKKREGGGIWKEEVLKPHFFSKIFEDGLDCVYVLRERGSRDGGKWRD